jgi:hypothetical protein
MQLGKSEGSVVTLTHNWTIGHLSRPKYIQQHLHYSAKMGVNTALTIWGIPKCKTNELWNNIDQWLYYWPPFYTHILTTRMWQCPKMSAIRMSTIFALASRIISLEWNADKLQRTYRQRIWATIQVMISRPPPTIERSQCCKAPNPKQQYTALQYCKMEFYAVILYNLSLCSTTHLCMQWLCDLIIVLVAVESIMDNPQSPLKYCYMQLAPYSDYATSYFLPPCRSGNHWQPLCYQLWSLPKKNVF